MNRTLKRRICALLGFFLLPAGFFQCALAKKTIVLPGKMKVVRQDMFLNDQSVSRAVLQEGVEQIESGAFAGSGLTEITLPATLKGIAEDAFKDCPLQTVHAPKGSIAYNWALERGLIRRYRALLIGEKSFDGDPAKRNAGDVNLMKAALQRTRGASSEDDDFEIVTKIDAGYSGTLNLIKSTFRDTRNQDVSVFFIATHGWWDSRSSTWGLAMYDGYGLTFDELAQWLNTYVRGKVIVIIESCFSGGAIYSPSVAENGKGKQEPDDVAFALQAVETFEKQDSGLAEPSEGYGGILTKSTGTMRIPRFYVLAASRHNEESYGIEGSTVSGSYNLFTGWLTDGIGSKNHSPADKNKDNALTLEEMFSYVSRIGDNYMSTHTSDPNQHVQRYPKSSTVILLWLK